MRNLNHICTHFQLLQFWNMNMDCIHSALHTCMSRDHPLPLQSQHSCTCIITHKYLSRRHCLISEKLCIYQILELKRFGQQKSIENSSSFIMKLRKRPARRTTRAWNCAPTPVITSCHPSKCISTCVTHFLSLSLSEYVLCFEDVTYVQPFYTCPQHTTPNVVVTCYVATSLHAIHQLKPRITCNG